MNYVDAFGVQAEKITEYPLPNGEIVSIGDKVILKSYKELLKSYCFDSYQSSFLGGAVVKIVDIKDNWGEIIFYTKILYYDTTKFVPHADLETLWYVEPNEVLEKYQEDFEYSPPINPKVLCCEYCGVMYELKPEEEEALPEEDVLLCSKCRERNVVLPYHRHKPELIFYRNDEDVDELYLGLEIEVDEGGENNREVRKILPIMNKEKGKFFIYCGHDSSLNNGFEIITNPATPEYHKSRENDYSDLFNELKTDGYFSHNTSTCGIHVHFNRNYFGDKEELCIARLLYLIEKFWQDIIIFSRRNKHRLNYCKKIDTSIPKYIKQWDKAENHDGHYFALNLINEDTIEFRIFRGTLNIKTFMCIIDFMENLIKTAKNKTINEIQKMDFEELLTDRAKEYYLSRKALLQFEE